MSEKLEKFRSLNNQIAVEYSKVSPEMADYFLKVTNQLNEYSEISDQDIRLAEFELNLLRGNQSSSVRANENN